MPKFWRGRSRGVTMILSLASVLACTDAASAQQTVRDFYAGPGKLMRIIVRTTVGGDYDLLSRVLAQHMGRYIPGNPTIIVVNMPGGGGIAAANYMGQAAPRDGTVLSIVGQGLAVDQALGASPQFTSDLRDFNWISNIVFSNPILVVWHTSPTKTLEDAKHRVTTLGTTGAGSVSVQFPTFYNNVLGTKFKLVSGYPGGQEINLAMERGEVEGRGSNTYAGYMAANPNYIPDKLIDPLIQIGLEKEPGLPDTPLLLDLPVQPEYRPLVEFMSKGATVGRPLATTPGVPPDRLAALRKAFDETMTDREFMADAKRQLLDIRPMPGETLDRLIRDLIGAPQDVKDRVKVFIEPGPTELQ
jgi:tripartite-type tricarboxylate transporter receptor subunit TctC